MFDHEHVEFAVTPFHYLVYALPTGQDLLAAALRAIWKNNHAQARASCESLYQLGLDTGNSLIQGTAKFCHATVEFALGEPPAGWSTAVELYRTSIQLYHTQGQAVGERNEGIGYLAIGRLYFRQSQRLDQDKWDAACKALEQVVRLFQDHDPALGLMAEAMLNRIESERAQSAERIKVKLAMAATKTESQTPPRREPKPKPRQADQPRQWAQDDVGKLPKGLGLVAWGGISASFGMIILLCLLRDYFDYLFYFLVGFSVILGGVVIAFFMILSIAHQLTLQVRKEHVGIVHYRGGLWIVPELQTRLLVPLLEHLEAYIPMNWRQVAIEFSDLKTRTKPFYIYKAKIQYVAFDAMTVWVALNSGFVRAKFLGMPKPVSIDVVTRSMDSQVCQITSAAIQQIVLTQPEILAQNAELEQKMFELVYLPSRSCGLHFESVEIESYQKL